MIERVRGKIVEENVKKVRKIRNQWEDSEMKRKDKKRKGKENKKGE